MTVCTLKDARRGACSTITLIFSSTKPANITFAGAKKSPYFGKVGDLAFAYATARG